MLWAYLLPKGRQGRKERKEAAAVLATQTRHMQGTRTAMKIPSPSFSLSPSPPLSGRNTKVLDWDVDMEDVLEGFVWVCGPAVGEGVTGREVVEPRRELAYL